MSVEIKTSSVEPIRLTFDHLRDRLGEGKQPTRYQEAVHDLQPKVNFHYRPTWDPAHELYDPSRTAVVMEDFEKLLDPRQYYYGTYTIQRAKQQDSQEANFSFVEKRGLLDLMDNELRERITKVVLPLRHAAWGANTNNCYIAAYGFGAPVTSAATFQMTDHLGIAQYITRIGLILSNNDAAILDIAKQAWMDDSLWQPLRKLTEDSMVTKDWFELMVLQNFVIDGLLHPLIFEHFDRKIEANGGAAFSMLTEFMVNWYAEATRWVDAVMKVAAGESAENRALLENWIATWSPTVCEALTPVAEVALQGNAETAMDAVCEELGVRAAKSGLAV